MKTLMQKSYISLILILFSLNALSQSYLIGYQIGVGSYSMEGLHTLNSDFQKQLPFSSKQTSAFPPYLYFKPLVAMEFSQTRIGLSSTFYSTGSRISAKDYSGEYRLDMVVNALSLELFTDLIVYSGSRSNVSVGSSLGTMFSTLKMNEYFMLSESILTDEKVNFIANNAFIEPSMCYTYGITSQIKLTLKAGYFIQLGNQAFYRGEVENVLYNIYQSEEVKPGWNGFRTGITVSYSFNRNDE